MRAISWIFVELGLLGLIALNKNKTSEARKSAFEPAAAERVTLISQSQWVNMLNATPVFSQITAVP